MTIYEIKRRLEDTAPQYFSRETMKFFGQTMKDFRVYKQKDGKFLICAPIRQKTRFSGSQIWATIGETRRIFNPETNKLERVTED
jgi:predicted lipase